MERPDTAPLFEPPESESGFLRASLKRRALASFVEVAFVVPLLWFPVYSIKPALSPSFLLSFLIYTGTLLFSYYFLGYFLLGKTLADSLTGLKIYPENFSLWEAALFSLVKTLFTMVPLNLILVFLLEENLTGEQLLFNRSYSLI